MCPVLAADNRASTGCDEQSDEPAAFLLHTLFFFHFQAFSPQIQINADSSDLTRGSLLDYMQLPVELQKPT